MIVSLAELVVLSLIVDWVFRKFTVPGLVGMLILGVVFGPYALNLIDQDLLNASGDWRLIALIVILLRAGFELSRDTLKRVGMRVLLLAVIPATIEAGIVTVLGPPLLGLTYLQSAILGTVLGAVSPAVVVPLMIRFMERRMGAEKGIPTMVLAASSLDDVYVIVVYAVLVGMLAGQEVNLVWAAFSIPVSIVVGVVAGVATGFVLVKLFARFNPRATKRVLVVLGVSVLMVRIEHLTIEWVPFAALIAVMAIGFIMLERDEHMAHEISAKLGKIWVFSEIVLFTMVGAQVNIAVALKAGLAGALIIALGLAARSIGTWACLLGSDLNRGERMFVVISYIPKATVQAAIGGGALVAMKTAGLDTGPGEIILAVAVLSILLTAPLGAWAIAVTGEWWLEKAPPSSHAARDAVIESEGLED